MTILSVAPPSLATSAADTNCAVFTHEHFRVVHFVLLQHAAHFALRDFGQLARRVEGDATAGFDLQGRSRHSKLKAKAVAAVHSDCP